MIYLTGSTGFIGTNLTRHLRNSKPIVPLSYRNLPSTHQSLSNKTANTLIHTAWLGVAGADRDSISQSQNAELTHKLCDFILAHNVQHVVAFGSQAEYGVQNRILTEDSSLNPTTQYGIYKVRCHNILQERLLPFNVNVTWLRLFDTFGPYDKPHWLIPTVIRNALSNTDVSLTLCDQYWDFLYIQDVVDAVLAILHHHHHLEPSSVFNLSSGTPVVLSDLVTYIYKYINPTHGRPLFGSRPKRAGEINFLCGSNLQLRQATGWSPTTDIYNGMIKYIAWYKTNEAFACNSTT